MLVLSYQWHVQQMRARMVVFISASASLLCELCYQLGVYLSHSLVMFHASSSSVSAAAFASAAVAIAVAVSMFER
jgi:hypothetical protein